MIRTAIISVTASFVLFGAWTVNLVSYHPATDLNPLAPLTRQLRLKKLQMTVFGCANGRACVLIRPLPSPDRLTFGTIGTSD